MRTEVLYFMFAWQKCQKQRFMLFIMFISECKNVESHKVKGTQASACVYVCLLFIVPLLVMDK